MTKPTVSEWINIPYITVKQYERYLPSAFDESLSLLQKVNKLIKHLDDIGGLLNGIGEQWNEIVDWVMNEGLETSVKDQLLAWLDDGTLADIIADAILNLNEIEVIATKSPYNAIGDGATDNTPMIQAAIDYLESKGGGTLRFPVGTYVVHGSIDLPSNIIIRGSGREKTILKKTMDASIAYLFTVGRTRGVMGYGGGAKNVQFENIQFEGTAISDTQYSSLSLTFVHGENIVIRNCRFLNCITQDHAVDLGGCNNVLIENCSFEGAYHIATREYNEAIQIDSAVPAGQTDFINYDGLPTKNVMVRGCQFLPVYNANGTVLRFAPNPVGSHGYTGGTPYTNIVFENNLVQDCWGHGTTNPATDWYAWIHFYGLADSKFLNNLFINSFGQDSHALGFYTSSNGRYDPNTLQATTGIPVQHSNIEIAGNTFKGFNNRNTGQGIIHGYGADYNAVTYNIVNIDIHDNHFSDNNADLTSTDEIGRSLIQFSKFSDIRIHDNKSDLSRVFVEAYDGWDLSIIGNMVTRSQQSGVYLSNVLRVVTSNNTFESCRRPLEMLECFDVIANGNVMINVKNSSVNDVFDYGLRLRNMQFLILSGNVIRTQDTTIEYGLYVYQTDTNVADTILILDNIIKGFGTQGIYSDGVVTNLTQR